jgi:hypothetical protein
MPKDIATEIQLLRSQVERLTLEANMANTMRLAVLIHRAETDGTTASQWLKKAVDLRAALTAPQAEEGEHGES